MASTDNSDGSKEMEEIVQSSNTHSDDGVDPDVENVDFIVKDVEHFEYKCLKKAEVEILLNETLEKLCCKLNVTHSQAKSLLQFHNWNISAVFNNLTNNLPTDDKIKPTAAIDYLPESSEEKTCSVCVNVIPKDNFDSLACMHVFCKNCWTFYIEMKVNDGQSSIMCIERDCEVLATEDFILQYLSQQRLKLRYHQYIFQNFVRTHPELRFCPGRDCEIIFHSKDLKARRSVCSECKTISCFNCGLDYHAPSNCETFKKWLSETESEGASNMYKCVNTKNCPNCKSSIEKGGGCNHIHCFTCKFHFCWQCLGDWSSHTGSVFKCASFVENPDTTLQLAKKRKTLFRFNHYYERWENHSKSLNFEKEACNNVTSRIEQKVLRERGSLNNCEYLYPASQVLAKCRQTLKYTYPKAYYMPPGPRRDVFEFQQRRFEVEIEQLSWDIENFDLKNNAKIQNQVGVCEQWRIILLTYF